MTAPPVARTPQGDARSDGSVLVTGAHGFLGRHVARALARRGVHVRGLGHGSWASEDRHAWGVAEWHDADVTLEALTAHAGAPGAIVHCAGSASVRASVDHPYEDFQRTVSTTLAVLEFVRTRARGAHVVLPSSGSVYGSVDEGVREDAVLAPCSPYAEHKAASERLCREFGGMFGVAASVVRLFSVYGDGLRKQLLWDACARLARGPAEFGGTGRERRDFVHVEDAVALLLIAIERASPVVPVVNGGTGVAPRVEEVLAEVAAGVPGAGAVRFTGVRRPGDPDTMLADTERARSWGWRPQVAWRDGVRAYCRWFAAGAR